MRTECRTVFKGFFQSEIAHQGADHARNRCGSVLGGGNGVQQLVAVVFKSARINHNQSVGVAIQRNAQVSVVFDHRSTQRAGAVAPTSSLILKAFG